MRTANSLSFNAPQFAVLSDSQMQDLHLAALETLRRTGIRFYHPEAIEMLHHAGAFVSDGNLVKITAAMVEDAIATVPGRVIMCDREAPANGVPRRDQGQLRHRVGLPEPARS